MAGMPRRPSAPAVRWLRPASLLAALACVSACTTTPAPPTPPAPVSLAPGVFILYTGVERDVCGIGLLFTYIPSNDGSSTADYAVLLSGPRGHVPNTVQGSSGDQRLPDNAVHPTHGVVVMLSGIRFGVNSIEGSAITLTALCAS